MASGDADLRRGRLARRVRREVRAEHHRRQWDRGGVLAGVGDRRHEPLTRTHADTGAVESPGEPDCRHFFTIVFDHPGSLCVIFHYYRPLVT